MKTETLATGTAASPGIGIGTVWVWKSASPAEPGTTRVADVAEAEGDAPSQSEAERQWARFVRAQAAALEQLDVLKQRLVGEGLEGEAALFDAHKLFVEDPALVQQVKERLQDAGDTAEQAVQFVIDNLARMFEEMTDEYFRERAADVRDVGLRLLRNLTGVAASRPPSDGPFVVVADDLTPSDTAELDLDLTAAFVTEKGGPLSHAAILARARGIPAVVGTGGIVALVADGDTAIVDGAAGRVVLHPRPETTADYTERMDKERTERERWRRPDPEAAVTRDGQRVMVHANISGSGEAEAAFAAGADGVGLFRTEYLYMNRATTPSETEQTTEYRRVVAALGGRPVTFRTLDVGGDKPSEAIEIAPEANPFLGWRGIRLSLDKEKLLRVQLRALLRSTTGELRVMFPMVTVLEEMARARALLFDAAKELKAEGVTGPSSVQVGMMVEVAATAMAVRQFAPLVDFFSLGTNDLVQYALAVDRGNAKVAHLYQPYHPGVLRLIAHFMEQARDNDIPVGVCGEMAGDEPAVPFFVGLGVHELSVASSRVSKIKALVRAMHVDDARQAVEEALAAPDASSAYAVLDHYRRQVASNIVA